MYASAVAVSAGSDNSNRFTRRDNLPRRDSGLHGLDTRNQAVGVSNANHRTIHHPADERDNTGGDSGHRCPGRRLQVDSAMSGSIVVLWSVPLCHDREAGHG
ncbi:hypothetical protein APU90_00795 [Rathayibacter toxicus]|uniref:Uncharacterized protein n=1 Tax=Rathayibacter toxicus TaxID=145458 RepID=A0A0C5BE94_9MICO|nr:hypothetical protein TI83_05675 [Rathayibacter toxicus]ALS56506.1 hypothetical protein APU90_00795 [Rathayibacter toxicus]KKM44608.1 hypothetical protein VT73_08765 [Rathayibacter toxicus]